MLMHRIEDQNYLHEVQYKDASNLKARMALHEKFGAGARPWHLWVFDHLLDLPADARVLELGCGTGALWKQNLERIPAGWQTILTDFSAGMLQEARRNLADVPHEFAYIGADAQAIPFEAGVFDAVVANHMLYHVPNRQQAFSEVRRVLSLSGRFVAATNGTAHMQELEALAAEAEMNLPGGGVTGFSLENGAEQLAGVFGQVSLYRLDDGLRVTEAEPILGYLRSYPQALSLTVEQEARLRDRIQRIIASKGAFAITKCSGLFEARS